MRKNYYLFCCAIVMASILVFFTNGCAMALHYENDKGANAKAKDVRIKAAKIDKGKADFNSSIDFWFWFPWKMNIPEKTADKDN